MQTTPTLDILNRLLDGTVNSVVQYAEIGAPFVPEGFDEQMDAFQRIADEEKNLANEVVAMIQDRDGVPTVGVFRFWNVDLNYLDIRFMAKFAVQHEGILIADLEAGLDSLTNDPEAHGVVRRAIEQKREHLVKLTEIASDY
mgnify:CR=1 FL=1